MIGMPTRTKVFVYVTRITDGCPELLVFASHDEPGFEVPKGAVEAGETLPEAALRELVEEAGITGARVIRELGAADWHDKRQHFLHANVSAGLPGSFVHTVTGHGIDAGLRYRFQWIPIDTKLRDRLVQGCDRFADALRTAIEA